jgi:hypothetical protein
MYTTQQSSPVHIHMTYNTREFVLIGLIRGSRGSYARPVLEPATNGRCQTATGHRNIIVISSPININIKV